MEVINSSHVRHRRYLQTVWISYNGEVYNYHELRTELMACGHSFLAQSDTEVIIHGHEAWGIERLLQRLRLGMENLERRTVRRLWDALRAGRLHWSRAWALVVLGQLAVRPHDCLYEAYWRAR